MRIAYIDCLGGASGDMLLGALLDAGLSLDELVQPLQTLNLPGWSLETVPVLRGHLHATQVRVRTENRAPLKPRGLREIENIIRRSCLPQSVIARTLAVFQRLGAVEAKIHQIPLEEVHFHEIGALDTIIDITGTVLGFHLLGIEKIYFSALPAGKGIIRCEHGILPNPAPATLELCRGIPLYGIDAEAETVTPTGAALLTVLGEYTPVFPVLRPAAIGYGAGTRDLPFPNLLRICIGETISTGRISKDQTGTSAFTCTVSAPDDAVSATGSTGSVTGGSALQVSEPQVSGEFPLPSVFSEEAVFAADSLALQTECVIIMETVIDDLNPERIPFLCEQLLSAGALDVWHRPAQMKKGRPGQEIAVIADPSALSRLLEIFFKESTTLGVRIRSEYRYTLPRRSEEIQTPLGPVKIKLAFWPAADGRWHTRVKPEFESCKELAQKHSLSLEEVYAVVESVLKTYSFREPRLCEAE